MSEHKHTPGPWEVELDNGWEMAVLMPNHEYFIEIRKDQAKSYDGLYANARLIAAAPDLLEAAIRAGRSGHQDTCSYALSSEYECDCGHDDLWYAIAKATQENTHAKD